jgi:hypothetical protein
MLAIILVLGSREFGSASYTRSARAQHGKISFFDFQSSERAKYVVNGQDPCIEKINDRWVIAVSRVAPGLAQWIALIYHQKRSQPSIPEAYVAHDWAPSPPRPSQL